MRGNGQCRHAETRLIASLHPAARPTAYHPATPAHRPARHGTARCGAWIYRIATNEALRILEQRSRKGTRLTLDDPSAGTTQMIADGYMDYSDLESIKLQRAILALPTKQQLAFNLRYYDELDYDEIASIIGTTAAGAKASYHIAKEKIIKYMNSTI